MKWHLFKNYMFESKRKVSFLSLQKVNVSERYKKSKNPILFQFQMVQHKLMSMCITVKRPSFSLLSQKYKFVIEIPKFSLFYTETVIYIPFIINHGAERENPQFLELNVYKRSATTLHRNIAR